MAIDPVAVNPTFSSFGAQSIRAQRATEIEAPIAVPSVRAIEPTENEQNNVEAAFFQQIEEEEFQLEQARQTAFSESLIRQLERQEISPEIRQSEAAREAARREQTLVLYGSFTIDVYV